MTGTVRTTTRVYFSFMVICTVSMLSIPAFSGEAASTVPHYASGEVVPSQKDDHWKPFYSTSSESFHKNHTTWSSWEKTISPKDVSQKRICKSLKPKDIGSKLNKLVKQNKISKRSTRTYIKGSFVQQDRDEKLLVHYCMPKADDCGGLFTILIVDSEKDSLLKYKNYSYQGAYCEASASSYQVYGATDTDDDSLQEVLIIKSWDKDETGIQKKALLVSFSGSIEPNEIAMFPTISQDPELCTEYHWGFDTVTLNSEIWINADSSANNGSKFLVKRANVKCQGQTTIYALKVNNWDASSESNQELSLAVDAISKRVENETMLKPVVRYLDWDSPQAKAVFYKSQLDSLASVVILARSLDGVDGTISIAKYFQKMGEAIYLFRLKKRKSLILNEEEKIEAKTYLKKYPELLTIQKYDPEIYSEQLYVPMVGISPKINN